MQGIIRTPVTSQDNNLHLHLAYEDSGWHLTVQNLCHHDLKRVTIIFHPKPPVFVSKEIFRIGTVPALTCSQPYQLSLRINHQALASIKRDLKEQRETQSSVSPQFRIKLLKALNTYMSLDDIKTLCFHLNIEDENIPGETRERKAAELISFCQRKLVVPQLLDACHEINPAAPWPDLPSLERSVLRSNNAQPVDDFPDQEFSLEVKVVYRVSNSKEMHQFQSHLQLRLQ